MLPQNLPFSFCVRMPSDAALAPASENNSLWIWIGLCREGQHCLWARKREVGRTGDYGNSKNSFAQSMQLRGMLENTVLSLPFLEVPWYADQATETPFYICSEFHCFFFTMKAT